MTALPALPPSDAELDLDSVVQSARRGRMMARIGLGLLPVAWFVALLTQAGRQMARDSCMGAECHYGVIGFDPWGVRFLVLSAALGLIALLLPARRGVHPPLRGALVAFQLLAMTLPTLICGYP